MVIPKADAALAPIRTAVRAIVSLLKNDRLSLAQSHHARAQAAVLQRLIDGLDGGRHVAHYLQQHASRIADAIGGRDGQRARAACVVFEQALEAVTTGTAVDPEPVTPPALAGEPPAIADPVRDQGNDLASVAHLGELVRATRKAGKRSQGELASRAGVGRRFVIDLESGKSTLQIGRVLAVCDAAGLVVTVSAAVVPLALARSPD